MPEIDIAYDTSLDAAGHDITLTASDQNRIFFLIRPDVEFSLTGLAVHNETLGPAPVVLTPMAAV